MTVHTGDSPERSVAARPERPGHRTAGSKLLASVADSADDAISSKTPVHAVQARFTLSTHDHFVEEGQRLRDMQREGDTMAPIYFFKSYTKYVL